MTTTLQSRNAHPMTGDPAVGCDAWLDAIVCGDCLNEMPKMPAQSVDAIISDLPYGTTACKWDSVIPFAPLWAEWKRLLKPNGAIVLFGCEPFSSHLRMSNLPWFKYDWTWDKKIPSGMSYAKHRPMQQTETISVFSNGKHSYNPQMIKRDKPIYETTGSTATDHANGKSPKYLGGKEYTEKNPTTLLHFPKVPNCLGTLHPTQKPESLMRYLVRTYTSPGDTILDPCCGSGTTCVAAMQEGRHYIGIEKEINYAEITKQRIYEARGLGV